LINIAKNLDQDEGFQELEVFLLMDGYIFWGSLEENRMVLWETG